jgi:hypothetical protein
MSAPLNDEHLRILAAVRDGRLRVNEHGRYVIDGASRPRRREREHLVKRRLIVREPIWSMSRRPYFLAQRGVEALSSSPKEKS